MKRVEAGVAITGLGVVCPLGIGHEALWAGLSEGRCGLRRIEPDDSTLRNAKLAGEVDDFDPAEFVKPRKALKVMSRDAQLSVAAAALARGDAKLAADGVDPDRFGVVFGGDVIRNPIAQVAAPFAACIDVDGYDFSRWGDRGLGVCYPLSLLKLLNNISACHISIAQDARGPNNTICMNEASGLSALGEAMRVVARGQADAVMSGGASSRLNLYDLLRLQLTEQVSDSNDAARACRPFDVDRDGQVRGEGAAALVLENASHADARGARIWGRVLGFGSACEPAAGGVAFRGDAVAAAVRRAMADARLAAADVGFVVAHGLATRAGDAAEARALRSVLPGVPTTGFKGYFGCLGAGCGAVEAAAAILALHHRSVPPTLHCDRPDPECPVDVVSRRPLTTFRPTCLVVSYTAAGQAAALVLAAA